MARKITTIKNKTIKDKFCYIYVLCFNHQLTVYFVYKIIKISFLMHSEQGKKKHVYIHDGRIQFL